MGPASGCPAHAWAVQACPFLAQLAEREGPEFATAIAEAPTRPVGPGCGFTRGPLLPEEGLEATFRLFHGPQGVVPLAGFDGKAEALAGRVGCPYSAAAEAVVPLGSRASRPPARSGPHGPALPLASMGMSFGAGAFGFGDFLRKQLQRRRQEGPAGGGRPRPVRRAPGNGGGVGGGGPASGGAGPSGPSNGAGGRPTRGPAASRGDFGSSSKPGAGSGHSGARGPPAPNSSSVGGMAGGGASAAASTSGNGGGSCPMRKWLGPLAGVVFDGRLHCPEPIVAARAALARTAPVRKLRPQALPLKLLAVAATAAAVNVPCGAWREHFEKFSFGWFVAVHATIPFVAMLRKAVVMPKGAILVTIAAAVAGQVLGSRLERARLAHEAAARAESMAAGKSCSSKAAAVTSTPARQAVRSATAPACSAGAAHEGMQGQLSCVMASLTPRAPGQAVGRLLGLPVTPLEV